jgi:hypothetical protein
LLAVPSSARCVCCRCDRSAVSGPATSSCAAARRRGVWPRVTCHGLPLACRVVRRRVASLFVSLRRCSRTS